MVAIVADAAQPIAPATLARRWLDAAWRGDKAHLN